MTNFTDQIITYAKDQGADLVGITNLGEINFPDKHNPKNFLPEARSAISIAYRLNKGDILNIPESRNGYMLEFNTVNSKLNLINHHLSRFIEEKGYLTFGIPASASTGDAVRLAADLSHKHLAVAAGLGKFGVNNLLITPEYGPRVRLTTIITDANLEKRPGSTTKLCNNCLKCVNSCPVGALDAWEDNYTSDQGWRIDKEKCYHHMFVKLNGKRCGLCIKSCPFTK